jgi:hypothetical protein
MPASRIPGARPEGSQADIPNPNNPNGAGVCKHPRVQIVSREQDAEYVECLECREIFEPSELQDMAIEEKIEDSEE